MAKKLKYIVLHCTVSEFGDAAEIRKWHVDGNGWKDIGYNAVVLNGIRKSKEEYDPKIDGRIEIGRGLNLDNLVGEDERGAHALGYNSEALGFALIGDKSFTLEQFKSALTLCEIFRRVDPKIKIFGHCEISAKTCPNFSMDGFRELLYGGHALNDFMIKNRMKDYLKGE